MFALILKSIIYSESQLNNNIVMRSRRQRENNSEKLPSMTSSYSNNDYSNLRSHRLREVTVPNPAASQSQIKTISASQHSSKRKQFNFNMNLRMESNIKQSASPIQNLSPDTQLDAKPIVSYLVNNDLNNFSLEPGTNTNNGSELQQNFSSLKMQSRRKNVNRTIDFSKIVPLEINTCDSLTGQQMMTSDCVFQQPSISFQLDRLNNKQSVINAFSSAVFQQILYNFPTNGQALKNQNKQLYLSFERFYFFKKLPDSLSIQNYEETLVKLDNIISNWLNNIHFSEENKQDIKIILTILRNRTDLEIQKLMKQQRFKQAQILSKIEDSIYLNLIEYQTNMPEHFKKEINLIKEINIMILPKTHWLIDLGLMIRFKRSSKKFEQYTSQIYNKYKEHEESFQNVQFLMFGFWVEKISKKDSIVTETDLQKVIDYKTTYENSKFSYLFSLVKIRKNQFPKQYQQITEYLFENLSQPNLFYDFLREAQVQINNVAFIIQKINNKKSIQKTDQGANFVNLIKESIKQKVSQSSNELYLEELNKWIICSEILEKLKKWNFDQFLTDVIQQEKALNCNIQFDRQKMLQSIQNSLIRFEFLCTYHSDARRQNYQRLLKVKETFQRDKQLISKIDGCIELIQLINYNKLVDYTEQSFENIYALYSHLKSRPQSQRVETKKIMKFIQNMVLKNLNTTQGEIFIDSYVNHCRDLLKTICIEDSDSSILSKLGLHGRFLEVIGMNKKVLKNILLMAEFKKRT